MPIYGLHIRSIALIGIVSLGFLAGYCAAPNRVLPLPAISTPAPGVTTVQVPVPVLTERVVTQYLQRPEDRDAIAALMQDNSKLSVQVDELSVSLAESESHGGGHLDSPAPVVQETLVPRSVFFKDWRLSFTSDGEQASYTLRQKFTIVNSVGTNKKGVPTQIIRLYEIDGRNQRIAIPTVDTTTIVASPNDSAWFLTPEIQAGIAGVITPATTTRRTTSGIVAISFLRRGTSRALQDTRWALLSPAVTFGETERTVGILPFSFNMGTIPHQPFTNLWVSPYLGTTMPRTINRIGMSLTATF